MVRWDAFSLGVLFLGVIAVLALPVIVIAWWGQLIANNSPDCFDGMFEVME